MSTFYENKKKAQEIIEKLLINGEEDKNIQMHIRRQYGFSERFTKQYIELLKDFGINPKEVKK